MVEVFFVVPGATTAGDSIDLPAWIPPLRELVGAALVSLSDATAAGTVTSLSVVTATPTGNQIQLSDEDTVVLGVDTTARDILIIAAVPKGEYSGA
ncbi:MAG: hypothetical protein JRD89_18425 [Deltaproteobacteria bacterium]|nr:hypothetical protein [Deltaproteobacteria bacterium]